MMQTQPKVYVETSVVSYLTAWRSRDIVIAGNQETTREWWDRRGDFQSFISQLAIKEASAGTPDAASRRLDALAGLTLIEVAVEVETVAGELLARASLPAKARLDALHIALATLGGMDYLLTWNCAHIANPALRPKIEAVLRSLGYQPPIICTPLELLEV
jgi:hypothetical protein